MVRLLKLGRSVPVFHGGPSRTDGESAHIWIYTGRYSAFDTDGDNSSRRAPDQPKINYHQRRDLPLQHRQPNLRSETHHEKRAALICLLTAALAARGTATIIGEHEGGWFWLPPWSLWQPWATEGLENAAKGTALKVTSVLDQPFTAGLSGGNKG
jgi:hypothetical protein